MSLLLPMSRLIGKRPQCVGSNHPSCSNMRRCQCCQRHSPPQSTVKLCRGPIYRAQVNPGESPTLELSLAFFYERLHAFTHILACEEEEEILAFNCQPFM